MEVVNVLYTNPQTPSPSKWICYDSLKRHTPKLLKEVLTYETTTAG